MTRNKALWLVALLVICFFVGCDADVKSAHDPTESGLMYVGNALVISALIRGFLNK